MTTGNDQIVKLVTYSGSDGDICQTARVSTLDFDDAAEKPDTKVKLIKFLMDKKHGCFDSNTDVLTDSGWKSWPDVKGDELFVTLNTFTDKIELQKAQHVIHKPHAGPMIQITTQHVDCCVTLDHNMVAATQLKHGWQYGMFPAKNFLFESHRIKMGSGTWDGDIDAIREAELAGFIAADGNVSSTGVISFHLKRKDKITWLEERAELSESTQDVFVVTNATDRLKEWAKATYTETGDRRLPRQLLQMGTLGTLLGLLQGYLRGDGSTSETGRITCSTVSRQMVDDIQELSLKVGFAANEIKPDTERSGAFGTKPLFRVSILRERLLQPRIGWTKAARHKEVKIVQYSGDIHCVTVSNGTLYVRRNGKPMWCGNTPFEGNFLRFYIKTPIFVAREFFRHRIGWSYNETSTRYRVLEPEFYVPPVGRPILEGEKFKPAAPVLESGDVLDRADMELGMEETFDKCEEVYLRLIESGIAREVARNVLPLATYTHFFASCNLRSFLHFLSLRTYDEGARDVSMPLWEIDALARMMEKLIEPLFPVSMAAYNACGRRAP